MTQNLNSAYSTTGWHPNRYFWICHFWAPLLFAFVSLYVLQHSNLDIWVADKWYALEGYQWAWRNGWLSYDLIHHHGKQGIVAFGLLIVGLIVLSYVAKGLRWWREPLSYLLATVLWRCSCCSDHGIGRSTSRCRRFLRPSSSATCLDLA